MAKNFRQSYHLSPILVHGFADSFLAFYIQEPQQQTPQTVRKPGSTFIAFLQVSEKEWLRKSVTKNETKEKHIITTEL